MTENPEKLTNIADPTYPEEGEDSSYNEPQSDPSLIPDKRESEAPPHQLRKLEEEFSDMEKRILRPQSQVVPESIDKDETQDLPRQKGEEQDQVS